mgnify:CR=1 FL=1
MKSFHNLNSFQKSKEKTIVTLGTFDGVHMGHQSILNKLKKATADGNYESVVLTFFPHPRMVLNQDVNIKLLNTIDEKATLLEKFGINNLIIHPFDEAFSNLSAEEFEKQIKQIKNMNTYKFEEIEKFNYLIPKKSILLTFDDGYKSNYTNAYPILKKYNKDGRRKSKIQ